MVDIRRRDRSLCMLALMYVSLKVSGPCTVSSSSLGSPFPPPSCLCPCFLSLGFPISNFLLAVISSGSTSDSLLSAVIVLFVRRGAVV